MPGPFDALQGEPLPGADADLLAEAAREGAHGHGLLPGHVTQLDRLAEAVERPGTGRGRGGRLRFGDGPLDVLRLTAVAVRRYDGPAGHVVGDGRPVVPADDMEAQVDSGGDARGGEDVPVVDEEHVGVDPDPREEPLEVLGVRPVGGGGAAVEIPGGGEDVSTGADGDEPGAGADVGEGGGQFGGQDALLVDRAEFVGGGDDDGVGGGECLRPVGDEDGEVGVGRDGARRPDRAGDDLVQGAPPGVP